MASVNKAIIVGNVGKDPEMRYMPNGEAVANFSVATTDNWKDKSGAKQSKTEWHNVVAYRKLAEIIGEYVKKGSGIYIEGSIQTRKWQTKEGQDRYTTEIIANSMQMLGSASHADNGSNGKPQGQDHKPNVNDGTGFDGMEDDIPFINIYRGNRAYVI